MFDDVLDLTSTRPPSGRGLGSAHSLRLLEATRRHGVVAFGSAASVLTDEPLFGSLLSGWVERGDRSAPLVLVWIHF